MTRASYNYDPQNKSSCGHHFFAIKTRSFAEHRKIAIRERSKRLTRVYPRRLDFLLSYVRHGTRRNKLIFLFVQQNFTWVVDKTECINYSHIHCIVILVIGRSSQDRAIHSRVLLLQWVMQTLGHCHLFTL